jgi:hypothetical protein
MIARFTAAVSLLVLTLSPAFADPFNINVSSGETTLLLVSITDMNMPNPKDGNAFSGNISPGQQISVIIGGNNGGDGHIQWTATTVDRQKCGSGDLTGLGTGNNVTVSTPSSC